MSTYKLSKWDVAEHLKTEEDMLLHFEACLEEGDPALITAASGDIARAKGMTLLVTPGLAAKGFTRHSRAKATLDFANVLKVVKALGLKLQASDRI